MRTTMHTGIHHHYRVEYDNPRTGEHWVDEFDNLVPSVHLDAVLDTVYKGTTPLAAWFVGLVTGPGSGTTYAAGNTMASHAGWSEDVTYSNSTRPACTWGAVASQSVDNTASKAVFNINGTATIAGCFLVGGSVGGGGSDADTKGGTGGTLAGCADFSSGDKSVSAGGTLTVTITATAASA